MAIKEIICNELEYEIGYELVNPSGKNVGVVLHGWGANRAIMKQAFGDKFSDCKLYFVDLPGFGASSIQKPLNSYDYTKIIKTFIDALEIEPEFIIGHSFGGKIATLLRPQNLILLSSAGIVPEKSFKVKTKIKLFKALKPLGFGKLYRLFASKDVENMSQTMYETFKNVVDEKIDNNFASFNNKALIFWGKEDTATPLKSGEKIHKLIKNSKFFPLDGDHFFFLNHAQFIADKIKEELCN